MVDIQVHNNWSIEQTVFPSLTCSAYETAQMSVSCKVEHKVLLSTKFFLQWMPDSKPSKTFWSLHKLFFSTVLKESQSMLFFVCLCIVNIIRMWTSLLFMGSGGKIKSFCWKIPRQVMHNVLAAYAAALTAGTQPEFAQITAWLHVMNTVL